jgi:hypothetical protein
LYGAYREPLPETNESEHESQNWESDPLELVVPVDAGYNGSAQTLRARDAQSADHGADADVDEHVFLAELGGDKEDEHEGADDDDRAKDKEAGGEEEALELLDGRDRLLGGAVQGDDGGSDDAEEAAQLAEERQALFEEDGGEDGAGRTVGRNVAAQATSSPNDHGQRA